VQEVVRLSGWWSDVTTADLWQGLSARARSFGQRLATLEAFAGVELDLPPVVDGSSEGVANCRAVIQRYQRFRGISLTVAGGPLEGTLTVGTRGSRPFWRTESGTLVVRVGKHDSAQAAMVMSSDGTFGCSWSFEFTPLFDSFEAVVEDAAAWASLEGWRHVSVLAADPATVVQAIPGLEPDTAASGELSQWWTGDGVAVSAAPFLNQRRSSFPQVSVLAESTRKCAELRRTLPADLIEKGSVAADLHGEVRLPPPPR
jgi:hypothetical protein